MHESAAGFFGSLVSEYDSLIRRAVPRYDELCERLLAFAPSAPARILELGSGTGNLSVALMRRFPDAHLTSVDASGEMLAVTRARLAELDLRHVPELVALRFEDLAEHGPSFDFVTSCISLHHVAQKGAFFRRVHQRLESGGTFLFADQLAGGDARTHDVHWREWLSFCRDPGRCSEAEIESLLAHARAHDHYVSLHEHFRMLHDAGFTDLDCVWRSGMWGVIHARRAGVRECVANVRGALEDG